MTNIVIGGLIEKENNFLLVQEAKEKCKWKWKIPAGHLEVNESVIDCLKREIKEENGCDILQTGILEIGNKVLENDIFLSIIFGAKLIDEKLDYNLNEILDVKWFSYDEIIKMKSKLRSPEIILRCIENYKAGKTVNLDVLNIL